MARVEAGPDSEVDLAIDFMPGDRPFLFELVQLKHVIETALGHPVDVGERSALMSRVAATATSRMIQVF